MKRQRLKFLTALFIGFFTFSPLAFADAAGPRNCTPDYRAASGYFHQILGEDAGLDHIPEFPGTFTANHIQFNTKNTIVANGDQVYLNVKLTQLGSTVSVPVSICKSQGKLVATLIMSLAKIKGNGSAEDVPLLSSMPNVTREIVIDITRDVRTRDVVFKSVTFPNQPAARVSVR